MKKSIIITLLILTLPALGWAAPFVVCDPNPGVTTYKLTGPAWVPATVPAQADGSIKMDVAAATDSKNSITVAACVGPTPDWPAERCSDPAPFEFTPTPRPVITSNIRLTP